MWLLLEFCDRGTLADGIDRGLFRREPSNVTGAPDFARIMAAAADVASGLAYLHKHSVLHGDVTGGNVLLKSTGSGPQAFKVRPGPARAHKCLNRRLVHIAGGAVLVRWQGKSA